MTEKGSWRTGDAAGGSHRSTSRLIPSDEALEREMAFRRAHLTQGPRSAWWTMDMEGTFTKSPYGKGYACTTSNCDGKGGSRTVACDNDQNCVGETPTRILHPVSRHSTERR